MQLKSEHASLLQIISDMHMGDVTARRIVFSLTVDSDGNAVCSKEEKGSNVIGNWFLPSLKPLVIHVSPKPTYCSDLFKSITFNFYCFSFIREGLGILLCLALKLKPLWNLTPHSSLDFVRVNSTQGVYCLLLDAKGLYIIKGVGYQYSEYLGNSRLWGQLNQKLKK